KPVARFVGDMVYGILAGKDVKLSSIVRALKEKTTPKKVEDRLSRMLSSVGLEAGLHDVIASEGARKVHKDTLVIIDPSDVQKPYARKMEYLAKVWDGSRGEVGDNLGYHGCMAVACESGGRRTIPLHLRLWSTAADGFKSEFEEVKATLDTILAHTKRRGIYVYDRGGDGIEFYRYFLEKDVDFIVRLKERHVRSWKRSVMCGELARECRMLYREVIAFDHSGTERRVTIEFGVLPVRLPDLPTKLLHMVVVRGFGKKPMMLLTTLAKTATREALWQVVEGYITRWRVEDTIRHVKQSYSLEDIRLFKYGKLKAMASVVLATIYFSMAWIGNSEKHAVIARSIARMAFRIHGVPDFHFYSIADGASDVLKSHAGRWRGFDPNEAERRNVESLFAFFGVNTG
ncbi:MAG: transposase, partial [Kiritimatiellae bacterium]|nr:transposase [Kiritimatiellia bacterium]